MSFRVRGSQVSDAGMTGKEFLSWSGGGTRRKDKACVGVWYCVGLVMMVVRGGGGGGSVP